MSHSRYGEPRSRALHLRIGRSTHSQHDDRQWALPTLSAQCRAYRHDAADEQKSSTFSSCLKSPCPFNACPAFTSILQATANLTSSSPLNSTRLGALTVWFSRTDTTSNRIYAPSTAALSVSILDPTLLPSHSCLASSPRLVLSPSPAPSFTLQLAALPFSATQAPSPPVITMSTPGAPPRPTPPQHPTAPIHPHPRSAALNPAHLHAPLPTHPEFQHDPHLPDNIAAARRLRITLSPLLSDPVPPLAEPQPPSPVSPVSPVAPAPVSPTDEKRGEEGVLHPVRFRKLPLVGKTRLSHDTAR